MEEDWEMLLRNEAGAAKVHNLAETTRDFEGVEGDSEGAIKTDYFSPDSDGRYRIGAGEGDREEGSVESDNPSWVDPGVEQEGRKGQLGFGEVDIRRATYGGPWSDSNSDSSVSWKFEESDETHDLSCADEAKGKLHTGGFGAESKNFDEIWPCYGDQASAYPMLNVSEAKDGLSINIESDLATISIKNKLSEGFLSEPEINRSFSQKRGAVDVAGDVVWDDLPKEEKKMETDDALTVREAEGSEIFEKKDAFRNDDMTSDGAEENKRKKVVWWMIPLEFLKFCAARVRPVWSFSFAAAVVGFVILGRRLYKMKHKDQSSHLRFSFDDKRMSRFMSGAARLNEAFSVVKRVPIIRPSMPAAGGVHLGLQ